MSIDHKDGYCCFDLVWVDRSIAVCHHADWLKSGYWHIELRSSERLPVTTTGYRSLFVPQASFADDGEIADFITAWLDDAATDKAWQAYLADSRQLKLF